MTGPSHRDAPHHRNDARAASGRPAGAGGVRYGTAALQLLDHGYAPLPLRPGEKRPAFNAWTSVSIDPASVSAWARQLPTHGIGLRTGHLVGIDIDILDPDLAWEVDALVRARLGDTLTRIGQWPKRLLVYQTETPFAKLALGTGGRKVEILGRGQQFVAFGRHPDTGNDYYWVDDSPLDVPLDRLPLVDEASCRDLLTELAELLPEAPPRCRRSVPTGGGDIIRDGSGRVVDGRDAWLSRIAFHTVHDAVAGGTALDPVMLARIAWERFADTSDLDRPHGARPYASADAARKITDKLRLFHHGRLPARAPIEAACQAPDNTVDAARAALDAALADACRSIEAWHIGGGDPPQIGVRATVGLGKSRLARDHMLQLRERLRAAGLPARILVLTPSHALAEEAAAGWADASVAVLRGYEAHDPITGAPMCVDVDAVRAAITAGSDIHGTACVRGTHRCAFFEGCRKQRNRSDVAAADIVIAPYDALFSGIAVDASGIGVILIDEGCWRRAEVRLTCDWSREPPIHSARSRSGYERAVADAVDRLGLAARVTETIRGCGVGPLSSEALRAAGLGVEACRNAATLERKAIRDPGLFPGMTAEQRRTAVAAAQRNEAIRTRIAVWEAIAIQLATGAEGRVRVLPGDCLQVLGVKPIHVTLAGKPVLHLDATLRPELARTVLPRLRVAEIAAAAPFMNVTLVAGSFGKGSLCPDPAARPEERQRRQNRLAECVDYVRWRARSVAPGRLLVVTYQGIEAAFANIPGVEAAHFNAIAGLDRYRDVAALIVIGRPLPQDRDLDPLVGAFFGETVTGGYRKAQAGVRMRDGTGRTVSAMVHEHPRAELLRAAICDDELVQAIGRGRGINRDASNPLTVHVLADVALPLVHDRVLPWELVKPDLMQRMLLAGVAVDSPGDACRLHPTMFSGTEQAKKALQRLFGGQTPMYDPYREMSPKSARYRRPGRGRSWQHAWWIHGDAEAVRSTLEAVLGTLAAWEPCD